MAIYFLLIFFFHAEYYLSRDYALVRVLEMKIGIQSKGCCVFEEMCCDRNAIDHVFHMISCLVYAEECETVKHTRMDLFTTIRNDADYYLI